MARIARIKQSWCQPRNGPDAGFKSDVSALEAALAQALAAIAAAPDNTMLLSAEAHLTKQLYKLATRAIGYGDFTRAKRGTGTDPANGFLDHGNYLAYGLAVAADRKLSHL